MEKTIRNYMLLSIGLLVAGACAPAKAVEQCKHGSRKTCIKECKDECKQRWKYSLKNRTRCTEKCSLNCEQACLREEALGKTGETSSFLERLSRPDVQEKLARLRAEQEAEKEVEMPGMPEPAEEGAGTYVPKPERRSSWLR